MEATSFTDHTVYPYFAAVEFHQIFGDRQSYAAAGCRAPAVV